MEKTYYSLRINTNEANYQRVSHILRKEPKDFSRGWIYEVESSETDYFDCINEFLDILEANYENLDRVGIAKNDISIWIIYEYNQQCNLEFIPKDLKRLGDNEISLCISCYERGN